MTVTKRYPLHPMLVFYFRFVHRNAFYEYRTAYSEILFIYFPRRDAMRAREKSTLARAEKNISAREGIRMTPGARDVIDPVKKLP